MKFKKVIKIGFGLVLAMLVVGTIYEYANRKWDGRTRFTIIDLGPSVRVSTFDPQSSGGLKLTLPDNLELVTVGGRGKWRAGVLSRAGGMKWAADSVADALGIPYTAIVGNMSWVDRLVWWSKSRKLDWKEVNLEETSFVMKEQGADGMGLWRLTPTWEVKAGEWFSSSEIAKEQLKAKIINTTSVQGLGAVAARVVENMGIKVVEVTGSKDEVKRCIVAGPQKSVGVASLVKWFGCYWKQTNEVSVTLGQDYQKWRQGL